MYRLGKPRCASCAVVALDVLDQTGVERYERSFFRALSPTYRKRATLLGIHNYGDVNRKRTTFARNIIHVAARFGAGLVGPDGTPRAGYATVRRRLSNYLR